MTTISTAGVHHVALTVTDVKRSQHCYTELLGFNHLTDYGPRACSTTAAYCSVSVQRLIPRRRCPAIASTRTASGWTI